MFFFNQKLNVCWNSTEIIILNVSVCVCVCVRVYAYMRASAQLVSIKSRQLESNWADGNKE